MAAAVAVTLRILRRVGEHAEVEQHPVRRTIAETRRQWQDFRSALTTRYGKEKGELMICALTHDDPVNDCGGRGWAPVVGTLLALGFALAAIATTTLLLRRRRQPAGRS